MERDKLSSRSDTDGLEQAPAQGERTGRRAPALRLSDAYGNPARKKTIAAALAVAGVGDALDGRDAGQVEVGIQETVRDGIAAPRLLDRRRGASGYCRMTESSLVFAGDTSTADLGGERRMRGDGSPRI